MKFLFVADPVENLKPAGDSSLAILRAALRRKHVAYWGTDRDVEFENGSVGIWASPVEACGPDAIPKLGAREFFPLKTFHGVWIRKDPPFDTTYVRLCWLLSLSNVWMQNPPEHLIRFHEKLLPMEALALGYLTKDEVIPSHIGTAAGARAFVKKLKSEWIITKPFLGFGGGGVLKHSRAAFEALPDEHLTDSVIQPFHPEVTEVGDRRVFFIDGKYVGDFLRMPKAGDFISNLAMGGTGKAGKLTARERKVADKVGKFLKKVGIGFAGADFIGHRVSEINITSPTGIRVLEKLEGRDIAENLLDLAEKQIKKRRSSG